MDLISSLKSKYKMSSETETFLQSEVQRIENGGIANGNCEIKKEEQKNICKKVNGKALEDFEGTVKQFSVPSAAVQNGVPIEVIKPKDISKRPGIIVNFHGGESTKSAENSCKLLARDLRCIFVNVEYRQPPLHKFPAMFDDGKAVVRWILMNKSLIGGENDSKVGVIGSSIGGGIAATCAFEVPGVDYQILVYPVVDWRCQDPSHEEFDLPGCGLPFVGMTRSTVSSCIKSESDRTHPRASPVLQTSFSCLPPTLMFIAEIDHLKHSNYEYKCKLKAANVECESKLMRGAMHGFFSSPDKFQETNQRTREIVAQFYKKHGVC